MEARRTPPCLLFESPNKTGADSQFSNCDNSLRMRWLIVRVSLAVAIKTFGQSKSSHDDGRQRRAFVPFGRTFT